jgi:hypothetical protein
MWALPQRSDADLARREHQPVARLEGLCGRHLLAVPHDRLEHILLGALDADVRRPPPDGDRPRRDRDLHSPGLQTRFPARLPPQQARGSQEQQGPADQAYRQRHRGEGEHAHANAVIGGDSRDQQVRAGADERDGSGQRGRMSDRQQHLPRRDVPGLLQLACGRDEHGDQRRRVHQRRRDTNRDDEPTQRLRSRRHRCQQPPGRPGDDAGLDHALGDHQHARDRDHTPVTQPREQGGHGRELEDPPDGQAGGKRQDRGHFPGGHGCERGHDDDGSQDFHDPGVYPNTARHDSCDPTTDARQISVS